jgi:metal-responsive CopG/Arc/MetJ family transcriptional regulator
MKKIGRPRKAVTKKNISVNLPSHVIDRVNDAISWQQSRSIWIEDAIINRLDSKTPDIEDIPLLTLLWEAKNREDCDDNVKFVIQSYLDSTAKKQSAETAE